MRSSEVIKAVRFGLVEAGVPEHVFSVESEAPRIKIRVLIGGKLFELFVRSKATRDEVDARISELRNRWQEHIGVQTTIAEEDRR